MQAVGRPKSQIERVMMSSQDLISNDPDGMIRLAAYLTRFDRFEQAIELYRQAAALDPSRPEAFVLALELAARTKNYAAVIWSAPEVLTYSWSKDRERLTRLAERTAAEAITAFAERGEVERAFELQSAMQKARRLDLVIRLEWNGQGDLDIRVHEPGGTICSTNLPLTTAGGTFVHDGFGPHQENCYEEYLCPMGFPGEYKIEIEHVSGTIVGKRARLVIVRDRGTANEETVTETVLLGRTNQFVRLSLARGRREANVTQRDPLSNDQKPKANRQPAYLAQLGNGQAQAQIGASNGAVGLTPVISMINEGVRMGAMATVSGDRRYVRINAEPIFSTITDVFTFTPTR